jgi:hypothetical protein
MGKEHALLLAAFLGAVAIQLGTIDDWQHVLTPLFVSGLIAQVGILIRGFYVHTEPDPDKYIVKKKARP